METDNNQNVALLTKLSFKDYLEIVGKLAIGFTSLCYLLGFMVVNIHLRRFGAFSAGLLSAQYLSAGLLALLPMFLGWFFVLLLVRDHLTTASNKIIGVVWVVVTLATTSSLLALVFVGDRFALLPLERRWLVFGVIGLFSSIPAVGLFWWLGPTERLSRSWLAFSFLLACFAAFFMFAYIRAFSRSLYGDISATAGGGKPRVVRLVPKMEARKDLALAGVHFTCEDAPSDPLNLLLITDKEYVFVNPTGDSSFSIPMETVRAMIYENR